MNVISRSTLCLAVAVLATGAHAQANTNPAAIAGTYAVTSTQNCLWADKTGPGTAPFSIVTGANGEQQVVADVPPNQAGTPPALNLISTVARFTLVVNPWAGTMTSKDMHVTKLDENRPGGHTRVLDRTVRTFNAPFAVDQSTGTVVLGTQTEQGTLPDGSTAVWTKSPGAHLRTVDLGQSIFGAGSDAPELIEEAITGASGTRYVEIACDRALQGQRMSLKTQ